MKKNEIQPTFQDLAQYVNQFSLDLQKDLAVTFTPHAMYTPSGAYELDPSIYETFKRCVDYTLEYYSASKTQYPKGYTAWIDGTMRSTSVDVIWDTVWRPFVNSIFSASYTWAKNIFDYIISYMDDHKVDEYVMRNAAVAFDINHVVDRNKFYEDSYTDVVVTFGSLLYANDPDIIVAALYEKFAPLIEMKVFNLMLNCYNAMRSAIADIITDISALDDPSAVSEFMTIIDPSFNELMRSTVTETAIFIKNIECMVDTALSLNKVYDYRKINSNLK